MENTESNTYSLDTASASTSQREKINKRKRKHSESEPEEKVTKKIGAIRVTEEDEELRCSICTELFITAVTLQCSHTFCKFCIDYWRRNRTDCPICRITISGSVSPTSIINNLVLKIIDKCSSEVKERRTKIIEERTAEAAAGPRTRAVPSIANCFRIIERFFNRRSRQRLPGYRTRR